MPISFPCPACGAQIRMLDRHAGRRARCKTCAAELRIPSLAPGAGSTPPPATSDTTACGREPPASVAPQPAPATTQRLQNASPTSAAGSTTDAGNARAAPTPAAPSPVMPVEAPSGNSLGAPRAHFFRPIGLLIMVPFFIPHCGPPLEGMTLPYFLGIGGAVLVALVFLYALSPRRIDWSTAIYVGAFTASVGVLLLLLLQEIGGWAQSHPESLFKGGANPAVKVIQLILYLVGKAYAVRDDPNLVAHLFGYIAGVGMCEELCKILPILWILRSKASPLPTLRKCMFLGAFSGLGFGISEAMHYSHEAYLPLGAPLTVYIMRFTALPAIHALWTATVAGIARTKLTWLNASKDFGPYAAKVALLIVGPAFLHGLYDVCQGSLLLILLIVGASVGLAFLIFQALLANEAPPTREEQRTVFHQHLHENGIKKAIGTVALVVLVGGLIFYSDPVTPVQAEPNPRHITITVPQHQVRPCGWCGGTGIIPVQPCSICRGHRTIDNLHPCFSCGGDGVIWGQCPRCYGTGRR